jgi:hypothetical protein
MALALAPLLAYCIGYRETAASYGSGWPLAVGLTLAALVWALRSGAVALLALVPLALTVPLLPQILGRLPFAADRCLAIGALAGLALGRLLGSPKRSDAAPAAGWAERWLLPLCLVQTLASALAGFWNALPDGAPLLGTSLWIALRDSLLARPLIDATHSLERGWLRLEWLCVALAAASAVRQCPNAVRHLARWTNLALVVGMIVSVVEIERGCQFRGQPFAEFFARGIPRNHRPLLDNNALGSALGLLLPIATAGFLVARGAAQRGLAGLGLLAGLLLLYSSRSKAALAGAAVGLVLLPLFFWGPRRLLARRWVLLGAGLGLSSLLLVQLAPKAWLAPLEANRRGGDLLRVLRLDFASDYLRENRLAPWSAAWQLGQKEPLFGAGLGRLPRRMAEFRDPDRPVEFNPFHENAHNQFLQSFAEEGLLGTGLLVLLFGAAIVGAASVAKPPRFAPSNQADSSVGSPDSQERWLAAGLAAGLSGLLLNSLASHSLLETTPGLLFGVALGSSLGLASRANLQGDRRSTIQLKPATRWVPALGLLALWPAQIAPPALESYTFGCYPWFPRPNTAAGRDRLLAPEAWWYEQPPPGERLVWLVKDVRSWQFTEILAAELSADGLTLLQNASVEHTQNPGTPNPVSYLKADFPAGLDRSRPNLWRLKVQPVWTNTLQFESGRQPAALRVTPLTAVTPR